MYRMMIMRALNTREPHLAERLSCIFVLLQTLCSATRSITRRGARAGWPRPRRARRRSGRDAGGELDDINEARPHDVAIVDGALALHRTIFAVAHVVVLLAVSAGDGGCLALDLSLQPEELLGVQAATGGRSARARNLGDVLVVHHAERACGSSGDGGGTHGGSTSGGCGDCGGFEVRGRQWRPYLWRIYNTNNIIKYATCLI